MNIHLAAILMLPRCQGLTCAHMYIVQEVAHFVVFWRSILDPHPYFFTCKLVVFEKLAGANWVSCCSISEWCRDIGVATQLGFSTLFISQTSSLATMSPDFEQHSGWFDQFDLYRSVSELTEEEAEHCRVLEWLPSSSPTAKTNLRGWA